MAEQNNEEKNYIEAGDILIPKSDNPWVKWGSVALQGLGKGLEGFAQGMSGSYGSSSNPYSDISEGIDAYRKKRQEAEEAKRKEEQEAKQKQEENTIKPIDNDNQTAWIDYANKYWRMG